MIRSGEINPMDLRKVMAKNQFALGDGTWVEFLKATPEQHEQRAAMLREQAAGFITNASLHDRCAEVIREHDVSCLAEVPEAVRPQEAAA